MPLAFLVMGSKVPAEEWKILSFKECRDILQEARGCKETGFGGICTKAGERMETIGTFGDWLSIHKVGDEGWALTMMKKLAKTIEEWKKIYDKMDGFSYERSLVLKELKKLAH